MNHITIEQISTAQLRDTPASCAETDTAEPAVSAAQPQLKLLLQLLWSQAAPSLPSEMASTAKLRSRGRVRVTFSKNALTSACPLWGS